MRLLIIILLFSLNASAQKMLFAPRVPWFSQSTINDDGYYNAFPMIADAQGQTAYGVYKKSASHAASGPVMLVKTTNGGLSWTEDTIKVDGVAVTSSNHSFQRVGNRMILSYKDTAMQMAYNDDNSANFIHTQTIPNETGYTLFQSPIKMLYTSYGSLIYAYYKVGSGTNPSSAELLQSLDTGRTFTHKATIYSHDSTVQNGGVFPNWRGNEIAICETHPTGVESTSKMIAIVRTEVGEGGTYPMLFKSTDGGNTWAIDLGKDAGSFVDDNGTTVTSSGFFRGLLYSFLTSNSPVSIRLFKDSVYVVIGERNVTYGYALKYITATPDGAFENKFSNWTRPIFIKFYNARTLGSTTDCGYPVLFTANNNLYVSEYDVSTQALNPALSTRRVFSEIIKIKE